MYVCVRGCVCVCLSLCQRLCLCPFVFHTSLCVPVAIWFRPFAQAWSGTHPCLDPLLKLDKGPPSLRVAGSALPAARRRHAARWCSEFRKCKGTGRLGAVVCPERRVYGGTNLLLHRRLWQLDASLLGVRVDSRHLCEPRQYDLVDWPVADVGPAPHGFKNQAVGGQVGVRGMCEL